MSIRRRKIRKPIFIVGCGRSGTTLLFQILKGHPQTCATSGYPDGEDHIGLIEHGKCIISGLGDPNINGGHTGFHYCLYMDESDVTMEIIEKMNTYYYTEVLHEDPHKIALNKCPHLSNKLRYIREIFPDAKFLHIIRDCLPVVSSWIKIMELQPYQVLYWPEGKMPCFWVFPAPDKSNRERTFSKEDRFFPGNPKWLVDYWSTVNKNIPIQLSDSPQQLLTVTYEDLCKDPTKTLERIAKFCEISPFPDIPLRIDIQTNQKYREHLTAHQICEYLERSSATRSQFGYI